MHIIVFNSHHGFEVDAIDIIHLQIGKLRKSRHRAADYRGKTRTKAILLENTFNQHIPLLTWW